MGERASAGPGSRGAGGQWWGWGRARSPVPAAAPPAWRGLETRRARGWMPLLRALRRGMNCFCKWMGRAGAGDAFPRGVVDSLSSRTLLFLKKNCYRSWKEESPYSGPRGPGGCLPACRGPSGAERGFTQRSARRPWDPLVCPPGGSPRASLLLRPACPSPCAPPSPPPCPDCRTPHTGHGPPSSLSTPSYWSSFSFGGLGPQGLQALLCCCCCCC